MDVTFFLIRLRLEAFRQSSLLNKLSAVFLISVFLMNGFVLGSLFNTHLIGFPEKVQQFMLFFPSSIYLTINLLQGDFYLKDPILKHHSISPFQRFIINFLDEYMRLQPLLIGLFSISMLVFWKLTTVVFSVQVIVHWLFMVAFVRALKQAFNSKPVHFIHFVAFIFLISTSVVFLFLFRATSPSVGLTILAYLLLVWACYFYQTYSAEELRGVANFAFIKGIQAHLWANRKAVLSLIIGILFKALLLGIIANFYFAKGYLKPPQLFFVGFFSSPIILFTYVFNNLWGFFPSQALSMQIATNKNRTFIKFFTQIFALPFLLDFIVTAIFYLSIPSITIQGFAHYGSVVIVLMPLSWHFSLHFPKKIGGLWHFSTTTNLAASFIAFGIISASWSCNLYYPEYLPLYLIINALLSLWLGYYYLIKAKFNETDFTILIV